MKLFFLIIMFISMDSFSKASPIVLEDGKDFYEIGLNLDILEDPTGKLTIQDVNSSKWESKFKRSQKKAPNFGFSKSAFWARFRVSSNLTDKKMWFLIYDYYIQDHIEFFKKDNNKWISIKTGDRYKFSSKEIRGSLLSIKESLMY